MADSIAGNPNVGLQRRAARRDGWTKAKRGAFLTELEASCNVTRACRAAGIGKDAAYGLRKRDPVFAAAWAAALDRGCDSLRGLMLSRALGTADAELVADNALPDDLPTPDPAPMDDEMRLKVLQICRASTEGRQGRASWRQPRPLARTADEVFASISAKLDRVERRMKRDGAG